MTIVVHSFPCPPLPLCLLFRKSSQLDHPRDGLSASGTVVQPLPSSYLLRSLSHKADLESSSTYFATFVQSWRNTASGGWVLIFFDYPLDLLLTTKREQDAGTGVQPFLPPVSASGAPIPVLAYKSLAYIVATFKLAVLAVIGIAYALVVALPETLLVSVVWPSSKSYTQAESVGLRAGIPA